MIILSHQVKPINPGIPLYRQPFVECWHYFYVQIDVQAMQFPIEQRLMHGIKADVETRRRRVDVEYYPGASGGHRFAQGNSHISTDTYLGSIRRICLSYARIENSRRQLGPSYFTTGRLGELACHLMSRAPLLIICDASMKQLIETSSAHNNPPERCDGKVFTLIAQQDRLCDPNGP